MTYKCPRCGGNMCKDGKNATGKQLWTCQKTEGGKKVRCYTTACPEKPTQKAGSVPANDAPKPEFRKSIKSESGAYLITWAQNATPAHEGFLAAALSLCDDENAELVVHPGREVIHLTYSFPHVVLLLSAIHGAIPISTTYSTTSVATARANLKLGLTAYLLRT